MSRMKLLEIEQAMNERFINREAEVRGLLHAALSEQHLLYLGPPGTAKSMMVVRFAEYLAAAKFPWLMTKYTTSDEIFGPVNIVSLKEGKFERVTTNKLPEAEVAFLDEVFKANSAILNALLTIMQERTYNNNGGTITVPLRFMVGASNELPEEDEGLAAVYDRFLIKFLIPYLDQAEHIKLLLALPSAPPIDPALILDGAALTTCINEVKALTMSTDAADGLELLWGVLRDNSIIVSDRRLKQSMLVMAAESWLQGHTQVEASSLIVCENIMWEKPDQVRVVKQLVRQCINPSLSRALEIQEAADEELTRLSIDDMATRDDFAQVVQQLTAMVKDLEGLTQSSEVEAITAKLAKGRADMMEKMVEARVSDV